MANNKRYTHSESYNKHFSLEERNTLQRLINNNPTMMLKTMAEIMQKDPTTLSKEVKKHRVKKDLSTSHSFNNKICVHFNKCYINTLCNHCNNNSNFYCKQCIRCINTCPDFKEIICKRVSKFPWVCNGCPSLKGCRLNKYFYYADKSNKAYLYTLHESRQGINITEAQLLEIDTLISPLIQQSQPIDHIYLTHEDKLPFSKRTLYNYIDRQVLSVKNIDLPRKVKYKPRKKAFIPTSMKNKSKIGRTYEDYQLFVKNNPGVFVVQMDCVEGKKTDSNRILTIHFPNIHFMIGFLLPNKEPISVSSKFDYIQSILGIDTFKEMFSCILTDNGTEFYSPEKIEFDSVTGELRTKLFYCHPMCSFQKAEIENNHRYIRYIIPKSTSIQNLTQDDLNIMFSHINSTKRVSTSKTSPYELACMVFGVEIVNKLGIKKINPNDVFLKPKLLIKQD